MKILQLVSELLKEFLLLCFLGLIVALAMLPLLNLDFVHGLDRSVSDLLMRQLTRDQLMQPQPNSPRIVFIDINEDTCEIWAAEKDTSCTLSMITPRDHLRQIISDLTKLANNGNIAPRLVAIDIELAPLPSLNGLLNPVDGALCKSVFELAQHTPVIVLRPITIGRDSTDASGVFIRAYPSVFDAKFGDNMRCSSIGFEQTAPNLWFASPVLQQDSDGIVRSVHAWDTVRDASTGHRSRLGGVGLLAAALIGSETDAEKLACSFPASQAPPKDCSTQAMTVGNRIYEPIKGPSSRTDRLLFLLPYEQPTQSSFYGYAPSVIDAIDAGNFDHVNPSVLDGAVVVIGGSYYASNDLHVTPLGSDMPGGMVHANAIRAYATGALIEERKSWHLKFALIAAAALAGATFHVLGSLARSKLGIIAGDVFRVAVLSVGVIVAVLVVLLIGLARAFADLAETGTALGTLTPALAVAFEGVCGLLHELKEIGSHIARNLRIRLARIRSRG